MAYTVDAMQDKNTELLFKVLLGDKKYLDMEMKDIIEEIQHMENPPCEIRPAPDKNNT